MMKLQTVVALVCVVLLAIAVGMSAAQGGHRPGHYPGGGHHPGGHYPGGGSHYPRPGGGHHYPGGGHYPHRG